MNKRVVFILGAGASRPYGRAERPLPTATELRQAIITRTRLRQDHEYYEGPKGGFDRLASDSAALAKEFAASGQWSIDRFLELRPRFVETGKMMIALELLPREAKAIASHTLCEGWYAWLFHQMFDAKAKAVCLKDVGFVTFNYDRTLEYALLTMLAHSIDGGVAAAQSQLRDLEVVHVYGALTSAFQYNHDRKWFVTPNPMLDVIRSADAIRIISDQRDSSDADLNKAASMVAGAEVLVILGFGFDRVNLRRIGIGTANEFAPRSSDSVTVYASMCGRGRRERRVDEAFLRDGSLNTTRLFLGDPDMDAATFLRESLDLSGMLNVSR